jgi:hypothetical protein
MWWNWRLEWAVLGMDRDWEAEMMMASDGIIVAKEPNVGGEPLEDPVVVMYLHCICSPGWICGRIEANPLKRLALLLREKLRAAKGGPCNSVQVQRMRVASNVLAVDPQPLPPYCGLKKKKHMVISKSIFHLQCSQKIRCNREEIRSSGMTVCDRRGEMIVCTLLMLTNTIHS